MEFYRLWLAELDEIMNNLDLLDGMTDTLNELGFEELAKETYSFMLLIKRFKIRADILLGNAQKYWKPACKYENGDTSKESAIEWIKREVKDGEPTD